MDFYLEPQNGEACLVRSATVYSNSNGLQIYWGINNFGFGEFSFYVKDCETFCHNEMCGSKTVGTVLKKAVWDMVYQGFDTLESTTSDISEEDAHSLFAIGKGGFRIYRNAHTRSVVDEKLYVSYFEKSNYTMTTLVFDNKTFPDLIDEESADFVLSDYLEKSQWEHFVKAYQTTWIKNVVTEEIGLDNIEKIVSAKFVKPGGEGIEIHWTSNKGNGQITIENHPDVQGCMIETFGKSKLFVMNVLDKAMESITLHDVKP